MGVAGLKAAHDRGEPLVEVTVWFRDDVDPVAATDRINTGCEDIDLFPQPWYDQPQQRVGQATRAALERLFGMHLTRVRLEGFKNTWRWEQIGSEDLSFSAVARLVARVGLSQPGQGDDGQPWE